MNAREKSNITPNASQISPLVSLLSCTALYRIITIIQSYYHTALSLLAPNSSKQVTKPRNNIIQPIYYPSYHFWYYCKANSQMPIRANKRILI
ncbi:hypothetical protein L873DRAFT_1308059 [Choiromyces venosus 120613-1]|uniref:Uncharacterized protein n=1 Tax=Choiromyces venosus 120613-1 TaxID=1336337 RepID=A0A3N4JE86_9PEZI|nr:hypothetical protein L873DRAFT_1308059 [Choiromyces venosus 120613-1]